MRSHRARLALVLALMSVATLAVPISPAAADVPTGFAMSEVIGGLDTPTAIDFADDGTVFIIEKRGRLLRFDSLSDPTPSIVADRRTETHNYGDRGMIGLAVNPDFPANPWVYVTYTLDQLPDGGPIPQYGQVNGNYDTCPNASSIGCPAKSRVVRFDGTANNGTEQILYEGHCQQYPTHSVGDLAFESSSSLLVSFGDGSTGDRPEWGQFGNACGDPNRPAGQDLSLPTAEGGQARAQDILTRNDPTGPHGSLLRITPWNFDARPNTPMSDDPENIVAAMVATGLRNPFRMDVDPDNGRIYVGNVGGAGFDEINLVEGNDLFNGGWPCYEGDGLTKNTAWLTANICQQLINSGAHDAPIFSYGRDVPIVPGEPCPSGGLSISGLAVNRVGFGPNGLDGALFFTDYTRDCIWYLPQQGNGRPDTDNPVLFASGIGAIVDLGFGPDGALYAVDIVGDRILRFAETGTNQSPTASFTVNPQNGAPPLVAQFDASASSDPDPGDSLSYQWDFDGNGSNDASGPQVTHTYNASGTYTARLTVTDQGGLASTTARTITVGDGDIGIVVAEPAEGRTFKVGALVPLNADATYADGRTVPGSAFTWTLTIQHCIPNAVDSCHAHDLAVIDGNRSFFEMPDHEYPSYIRAELTVDPPDAAPVTAEVPADYRAVDLHVRTEPAGIDVLIGSAAEAGAFTRPVASGSLTTASVEPATTVNGVDYVFDEWRVDGVGAGTVPSIQRVYDETANLTAVYRVENGGVDTERPSTPSGVEVQNWNAGLRVLWNGSTDNVGVTGYQVFRSTNGTLGPLYQTVSGTAFTDTDVVAGTAYTYTVKAIDAAGNTSWRANLATLTRAGGAPDTERPSTPSGVEVQNWNAGLRVLWNGSTDNVGVTGYQVFRSTNGTLGPLYQTVSGTAFTDTDVVAGTAYTYTVKAIDAAGNTSWRANLATLTRAGGAPDTERPSTPSGVEVQNWNAGLRVLWNGSTDNVGVTGYQVFRSTNGTLGPLYQTVTGTAFTDTDVVAGTAYTYTVKAIDAAGNTSWRANLATLTRQ